MGFIQYIIANQAEIIRLMIEHIQLTFIAVGLATLIGVPIGILICYVARIRKPVLAFTNLIQAVPSMALLGFAIPLLGIGNMPSVVVVTLYSLLPIIKNTVTGVMNINPQTIEAAKGIGLTKFQILYKVEIPLAAPMIMAGVRISAVTAVGLMTMAAFIGGGGLGYLVFAGIRTVNNYQILAGAIPACILALFVDYLCAIVERVLTPKPLLPRAQQDISKKKSFFEKGVLLVTAAMLIFMFITSVFTTSSGKDQIIIGSKDYTEQVLISEMLAQLVEEKTDMEVIRKLQLGGTQVAHSAILNGDIDMYVEYSGTAYVDILKNEPSNDVEAMYQEIKTEFLKQKDLVVLKQMNFNNTYTLAVTQEVADKYNLKTFSDLQGVAQDMKIGNTLEFENRVDGFVGMNEAYGLQFKETVSLDGSSRYIALANGDIDIVNAFSTDGLIKKYNLVVLEDDKSFFVPYYATPVVRNDMYEKHPELEGIIDELGQILDESTMMELNYRVDELQQSPEDVARDFLQENGFTK